MGQRPPPMKYLLVTLLLSALVCLPAHAEIYKYVDANGNVTFTDVPRKGERAAKIYDLPARPLDEAARPKAVRKRPAEYGPANFPRINPATQRKRDDLRMKILNDELARERKELTEGRLSLAQAQHPLPGEQPTSPLFLARLKKLQDAVARHQQNISAIRQEINIVR